MGLYNFIFGKSKKEKEEELKAKRIEEQRLRNIKYQKTVLESANKTVRDARLASDTCDVQTLSRHDDTEYAYEILRLELKLKAEREEKLKHIFKGKDYLLPDKYSNDEHQRKVIKLEEGHQLVLAPPGCGKTDILAERIMLALSKGVDMKDMLCLTFTNRAARGMKSRIEEKIGQEFLSDLFVGNLHRFCSKFLYEEGVVSQTSSILDETDTQNILLDYLGREETGKDLSYQDKEEVSSYSKTQHLIHQMRHAHPQHLWLNYELISQYADNVHAYFKSPRGREFDFVDFYDNACRISDSDLPYNLRSLAHIFRVAKKYEDYKMQNGLLDFDDLLLFSYDYFIEHKDQIKKYKWIQVDEVQDLNRLQLAIIDLITDYSDKHIVLYLGDEQQAIFSFIGAELKILDYLKEKCGGTVHRLYNNYRSPNYLLEIYNHYANMVLDVDTDLLPKANCIEAVEGGELRIICGYNSYDECKKAVETALEFHENSERTALLVSANATADTLSEIFGDTPHFKISGKDVFSEPLIHTLFAHFNVVNFERNFIAWSRILRNLNVFPSYKQARNFLLEMDKCLLAPTDFLAYNGKSYIKQFVEDYKGEFVIFDTETTGLSVFDDDIVQIAAIKLRNGKIVDNFNVILHTDKTIPLHLGNATEPNPLIKEYAKRSHIKRDEGLKQFLDFVGSSPILGHNAEYDYRILDFNLRRDCGITDLANRMPKYYDSLKIMRIVVPGLKSYKLKNLLSAFNLEGENSHLADDDIKATKSVCDFVIAKAEAIIPSQAEFLDKYGVQLKLFIDRYQKYYQHSKTILYDRSCSDTVSAFTKELRFVMESLVNDGYFKPLDKFQSIVDYIELSVIDQADTRSLYEQLCKHIMEINTSKEADMCGAVGKDGSPVIKEKYFISTVHKAKGLEFENVLVIGVNDGIYPFFATKDNPVCRKEDARKLYVALSRAKKRLYLFHHERNQGISQYGKPYDYASPISPFVNCIKPFFDNNEALYEVNHTELDTETAVRLLDILELYENGYLSDEDYEKYSNDPMSFNRDNYLGAFLAIMGID